MAFFVIAICFFIYQGISVAASYDTVLERAWAQEIRTAQGMAGSLLADHPELEREIAAALQPEAVSQNQQSGAEALSKYGFGRHQFYEDDHYQWLASTWQRSLLLFVVAAAAAYACLFLFLKHRYSRQKAQLQDILEQYLSGDYSFASAIDPLMDTMHYSRNSHLSDLLKQLGNAIRLNNMRLTKERENTKSLVTDISHQLKTPVASLKTCIALVLEADNPQEQAEFLHRSEQQVEKMEGLIEALMNISRLETSMITLHPVKTSLQELLIKAANAVYDKARSKDITLELQPFDDISLMVDERWTAEALVNVLDNSIKYSPSGSLVVINVQILVSFIRIKIKDEGIGIPREEQTHIFERFYRGSHPAVRAAEGAGVGLYLTRMIMERQGGGISLRSRSEKGSVFAVQLPKIKQ